MLNHFRSLPQWKALRIPSASRRSVMSPPSHSVEGCSPTSCLMSTTAPSAISTTAILRVSSPFSTLWAATFLLRPSPLSPLIVSSAVEVRSLGEVVVPAVDCSSGAGCQAWFSPVSRLSRLAPHSSPLRHCHCPSASSSLGTARC